MAQFPKHNIDPRSKGKQWCLDFIKAAYSEYESSVGDKMFYRKAPKYEEIKTYALGKQAVSQYKKAMGVDEETNTTYANIDFKIFSIIRKQRQTALSRLLKNDYNIIATTFDTQARNEMDEYYAQVKAKLAMRKAVEQEMPEMLNHPMLQLDAKDAQDLEELEMQAEHGFKHSMAIEAEDAVALGFRWNDIDRMRAKHFENLFDDGVSVVKDWMDKSGKPKMRNCDNRNIITNYCRYPDFRDLLYAGEVVEMTFHQFKEEAGDQFTAGEYEDIYNNAREKYNNVGAYPAYGSNGHDKAKVWVLDMEWFTTDEMYFESRVDSRGNLIYKRAPYDKVRKSTREYKSRCDTMVYKGKWIVGSDYIYDYGKQYHIKRAPNKTGMAQLNYHIEAVNLHNMECKGIMEDLIPIADQIQIAWLKWQNIQNTLLPYLIEVDLDSLEDVAIGKAGETMNAKEVLDMAFQNGILVTRRRDIAERNINYKAVEFIETNYGVAVQEAWNNLVRVIQMVNEIIGLNAFTDASTPDPKSLTNPALLAAEGTNNALYDITVAERRLMNKMANAMVKRMQQAVHEGKVDGWIPAVGTGTVKFIQLSPKLELHEIGIFLEDKPDTQKRQLLMQEIMRYKAEGLLDPTDAIMVESEPNLKRAEKILAYRIRKRKEQQQKEAIQMQQVNAQVQVQSAQAASEMKKSEMQMEYQLKAELLKMEKEYDMQLKQLEFSAKTGISVNEQTTKERIKDKEMGYAPTPPIMMEPPVEEVAEEEMPVEEEIQNVPQEI